MKPLVRAALITTLAAPALATADSAKPTPPPATGSATPAGDKNKPAKPVAPPAKVPSEKAKKGDDKPSTPPPGAK